ncbi:cupin domain-containing protein [Roseovarius spongiae]|uniref:Cupin domain-containing protein n=1 Tax=Roseovarius spongiae TaxID=2320272 RepID=A0A3A8B0P8_9RHOB|nr:cupin domain-containing protein [Roseovarius spongiae]RKF17100.1 cupin domain-containing protein [Roseovarius spongiae]
MDDIARLSRSAHLRGPVEDDPITDLGKVLDAGASVGKEIKDLRKASDVTLAQLSRATGLSQGYLSQVERGISSPSVKALHTISRALGVNISWFFRPVSDPNDVLNEYIVRKGNHRMIRFANGITDELLSPNLARGIELLRCTFPPGSQSGKEAYEHKGEEAGFVVAGRLTLWLEGRRIELETGDSFAFESTLPHRYANEGDEEAVIIWSISPPSY